MPCDCQGFSDEDVPPPLEFSEDCDVLPAQYRMLDCYGIGIGWYQYAWDQAVADDIIRARYAHVLDAEMIDDVTWMQAIEMVSGYDAADLVD